MRAFFALLLSLSVQYAVAQCYWQQSADYAMDIEMDVNSFQYKGKQSLRYSNHSPDTLYQLFYHLYFNAFQPGSMMDVRSRSISDPDQRVGDRIYHLSPEEVGWIHVKSLSMNGQPLKFKTVETILEVSLPNPIGPHEIAVLDMEWEAQVPVQIRRSGHSNAEGIALSMAQWYPKICEYDFEGWHADPYVGREFYGVWGDFEVNITLDADYVVASTGIVQNPDEVGHGYGIKTNRKTKNNTWKIKAENVHDFVWAADPDYLHDIHYMKDGTALHFFYQNDPDIIEQWKALQSYTEKAFNYLNKNFGQYPYKKYSVIQGGDGGMEYPMATLITGKRNLRSLVGVTVHEAAHSWYQGVLASNEALYEWMDEGFTSYATSKTMASLFASQQADPHHYATVDYLSIAGTPEENALCTPADFYMSNRAYGSAAYSKGEVLLNQLNYIIGEEAVEQGLLSYFDTWKFRHPAPNDFKRVMEKQSGIELDWYFQYFEYSTHTIDYGIEQVLGYENETIVTLTRIGEIPMPQEVEVLYKDGSKSLYYFPLVMMHGEKPQENNCTLMEDWPWTSPRKNLVIPKNASEISSITIDPAHGMADKDRSNNQVVLEENQTLFIKR